MEFSAETWPEHSEELKAVILGQCTLQFHRSAGQVTAEDSAAIDELALAHPLNTGGKPLGRDVCEAYVHKISTNSLAELQLNVLSQVKTYIEHGLAALAEPKPRHKRTRSRNAILDAALKKRKVEEDQESTKEVVSEPVEEPVERAESPVYESRLARRRSRARRSARSTPEAEEEVKKPEVEVEEPKSRRRKSPEASEIPVSPPPPPKPVKRKRGVTFEETSAAGRLVNALLENKQLAFMRELPAPSPVVKHPSSLAKLAEQIEEHAIEAVADVHVELLKIVANAVMSQEIDEGSAKSAIGIIETTVDRFQDPPPPPPPASKRRRR